MSVGLVGPVVGPLSGRSLSTSLLVDSKGDYDFAIGGLGFKMAISDERPYERATAQFRKEQFDSQSSVGDQSLTGWWTRAQLSFHRGSGVNYYEVLDGNAVSNSFKTSENVTVSVPGRVTLRRELAATVNIFDQVKAGNGYLDTLWFIDAAGELNTSEASAYPAVVRCAAMHTAQDKLYIGVADEIHLTNRDLDPGSVLYTHSENIDYLWFAKGRLWMVDALGDLYQLSPNPGSPPVAITGSDLVVSLGVGDKYLAEGAAAVYFGNRESGEISAVTIGDDGSLPTITAPVVVATLPEGDDLVALSYYLGFLVIQTATGVRLAVANGREVTVGPQFVDVAAPTPAGAVTFLRRNIAGFGNKVYLTGEDSVFSIDLAQTIEDTELQYAWVTELSLPDAQLVVLDANAGSINYISPTENGAIGSSIEDGYAESGYLLTGQHRFGTLEPKQFVSVKVLAEGDGGTIVISRVDQAGNATSLYTLNLDAAKEADITLGLSETAVSMALRFDLNRESETVGPTLLGYQLRALPAPKRQRMIRIPLMLFDAERRQPVRASGAAAWSRLAALESMEQSGGTFTYQDYRTGESGQCFIEQVEHQGKTPPSAQSKGFGGYVFLTIRVI